MRKDDVIHKTGSTGHATASCIENFVKFGHVVFFRRPFVKRFSLRYQTVVCLSVLSVTSVYRG